MPLRWQNFLSCRSSQRADRVVQGLTAPSAMDLEGSGTTRSGSMSMTRPNPWQVSHAPSGLLNEKRLGCGSA